ncbi:envelope stress response membrane protein PspC [Alteromonas lipolytica]|uniref:Phage shock protein C n=1 Tax=Alteromonas lipolytica TaxID=1856405 RepID=A0A1E8FED3_9ALTE|nr:envelope stress response membrane protein PspC [Alteromonas lipolytica]OFI34295.1 phage shock protein C [Alteromonas lipolytica]GGF82711.1 phage-shock protein [Alteromonas lipolytica]
MSTKKTIYRDTKHGRIAGVCAGVAEYFGLEVWLVRILTVTAFFLLAGPFVLVSYVACWFIFDKKPEVIENVHFNQAEASSGKGWKNSGAASDKVEVKTRVWQAGEPPRQAFHDITNRFQTIESRLRKMETYVTSREYQLNREISRL